MLYTTSDRSWNNLWGGFAQFFLALKNTDPVTRPRVGLKLLQSSISWILWIFGLTQSIGFKLSQLNTSIVSNFNSHLFCERLMLIITLYVIHITDWILIIVTESPVRRSWISSSRSHRFSCVETHQLHSVSCKRVTERMKSVEISFLSSYLVQSIHLPSILQANRLTAIICLLKNWLWVLWLLRLQQEQFRLWIWWENLCECPIANIIKTRSQKLPINRKTKNKTQQFVPLKLSALCMSRNKVWDL